MKNFIKKHPRLYAAASGLLAFQRGTIGILKKRRGAREYLRATLSLVRRSSRISGRPINVTIEPANVCNIRCPVCETGAGILGRKKEFMSFDQFKIIIDKIARQTNTLIFYFMGEPFLNKYAYDMIRHAKQQGIPFITSCTNGDLVNPERLVKSGIDEIHFQIGGMTQNTHTKYRSGSDLKTVLENLRETVRLKKETQANMKIVCGFILMKHNEHEVGEFKKTMFEIGVDQASLIDPCVRTLEQGQEMLPTDRAHWIYNPEAFEQGVLRTRISPMNSCPWIYYSMTIQVNGDVVPCCRDAQGRLIMGNILSQDLEEIWNGPKFRQFRINVNRNQKQIDLCQLCSGYGISTLK